MSDIEVFVDAKEFQKAGEPQKKKLRKLAKRLRTEPFLGDRIRRDQVPKRFEVLPNLFRVALTEGWRALYTVAASPTAGREVRIVWMGDHDRYDRLFGYS